MKQPMSPAEQVEWDEWLVAERQRRLEREIEAVQRRWSNNRLGKPPAPDSPRGRERAAARAKERQRVWRILAKGATEEMSYDVTFCGSVELSRKLTLQEAHELLDIRARPEVKRAPLSCYPWPPGGCLQWVPSTDLKHLVWDEEEHFVRFEEWLRWVCAWLHQRGIAAAGEIRWQGDSMGDSGTLDVTDNRVSVILDEPTYRDPLEMEALLEMMAAEENKP